MKKTKVYKITIDEVTSKKKDINERDLRQIKYRLELLSWFGNLLIKMNVKNKEYTKYSTWLHNCYYIKGVLLPSYSTALKLEKLKHGNNNIHSTNDADNSNSGHSSSDLPTIKK